MSTIKPTPSAKEQLLKFVRSKNPQTTKHRCCHCDKETIEAPCSYCGDYNTYSDESDMGLQELLIALLESRKWRYYKNQHRWDSKRKCYYTSMRDEPCTQKEYEDNIDESKRSSNNAFMGRLQKCAYWTLEKELSEGSCSDKMLLKIATELFDLTKNLHEQSDEFFESLLPLLPNE